ncbi:MAG: PAS domain S-box protein [Bacteroidales bacterium]
MELENKAEFEVSTEMLIDNMLHGYALQKIIMDDDGIVKDFRIIQVNNNFCEISNRKPNEIIGRTAKELFPYYNCPEGEELLQTLADVAIHGTKLKKEIYDPHINKWLLLHVFSPKPQYFISMVKDITERKEDEIRLREKNAELEKTQITLKETNIELENKNIFFNQLIENITFPFFFKDEKGIYKIVNNAFAEFNGYSKDFYIGRTICDCVQDSQLAKIYLEADKELMEKKGTQKYQTQIKTSDGNIKDVIFNKSAFLDEKGNVKGLMGFILDITELIKKEKELQEAEKRFQLSMSATSDGIWDWHIQTAIFYFSPGFYSMLGYENQEIVPTYENWVSLFHPEDKSAFEASIMAYFEGILKNFEVELRIRSKHEGYKWILIKGNIVEYDLENRPTRIIGTHIDIDDRKKYEIKLNETNNELTKLHKDYIEQNATLIQTLQKVEAQNKKLSDAYQQLVQSEEKFRLFSENSNDVFWITEGEQFIYQEGIDDRA